MFDKPKERFKQENDTYVTVLSHPITTNEIHAAVMGLSGSLFGTIVVSGGPEARILGHVVALFLAAYAIIGDPALHALPHSADDYANTIGLQTLKKEPWWFLASFVPSYLLGRALAAGGITA